MKKSNEPSFWITNISNRDVALSDLALSVRAHSSINLLDKKHYPYLTLEMINNSQQSGSIFKKSDKIKQRKVAPKIEKQYSISTDQQAVIPTRQHSIIEIKQEKYEELSLVEEDELLSTLTNAAEK